MKPIKLRNFSLIVTIGLLASLVLTILIKENTHAPSSASKDEIIQIGTIKINKTKRFFTVKGVVINGDTPLEYLAVARGSMKGYESLLELDTIATEFNLACILLGLTTHGTNNQEASLSQKLLEGDRVVISLALESEDTINKYM